MNDRQDTPTFRTPSRGQKWLYMGVVVGAPVVHVMVSAYRKFPQHRKLMIGAIAVSTASAWITRIVLMYESGFMFEPSPIWKYDDQAKQEN